MLKNLIILAILGYGGWYAYDNYFASGNKLQEARAYAPKIIKVTAKQVDFLIESGDKNEKPTLLYIFESNCLVCRWYYSDIMHFVTQYTRNQLNVIVLSMDSDDLVLAEFFVRNPPAIRPLMLKEGERERLFTYLRNRGSDYDGTVPYIAVINKAGHFDGIGLSWDPKNKINGFILRALDVSS